MLWSHLGWDPGALTVARAMARDRSWPLVCGKYSRLWVELNRSRGHPRLWSDISSGLPDELKRRILEREYGGYRKKVVSRIDRFLDSGRRVIHWSIHTFTPILDGVPREVDAGILFDPRRHRETALAMTVRGNLERLLPEARVRFNQPYEGTDDGLTTSLRGRYPESHYIGIELEITQQWFTSSGYPVSRDVLRRILRAVQNH